MTETDQDLQNERLMAAKVMNMWQCQLIKLPKYYHLDYALVEGDKVRAFVEFRKRDCSVHKYTSAIVNLHKMQDMQRTIRDTDKPVFLVYEYSDGLFMVSIDAGKKPDISLDPRPKSVTDAGKELIAHIPTKHLKPVAEGQWLEYQQRFQKRVLPVEWKERV